MIQQLQQKFQLMHSAYGLGAVLLQQANGVWRPVSFASLAMSETERRYAQIEKEALTTSWACQKFFGQTYFDRDRSQAPSSLAWNERP